MTLYLANRITDKYFPSSFREPKTTNEKYVALCGKYFWNYTFMSIDIVLGSLLTFAGAALICDNEYKIKKYIKLPNSFTTCLGNLCLASLATINYSKIIAIPIALFGTFYTHRNGKLKIYDI